MTTQEKGLTVAILGIAVAAGGLFGWLPWYFSLMIIGGLMVIVGGIVVHEADK